MAIPDPSAMKWVKRPKYVELGNGVDAEFEAFRKRYMTGDHAPILCTYRAELQDEQPSTIGDCRKLFRELQLMMQEQMCIATFILAEKSKQIAEMQKRKMPTYKGVWSEDQLYQETDLVTLGGSLWFCKRQTTGRPSTNHEDWQLAVKSGRDGRPR